MEKLHLKLGEEMEEAASAAALTRGSLNASREKEAASEAIFRRVCQRDNTGSQMTKMPGKNSAEFMQRYLDLTLKNLMELITSVPPVIVVFFKKDTFAELGMECKTAIYAKLGKSMLTGEFWEL